MSRKGVGYVIIRRKDQSGLLFEEPTVELQGERKSILIIQRGGTGFIVEKFDTPFSIADENCFAIGVVLTAAHTCYSPLTFKANGRKINCGFTVSKMKTMQIIPLRCFTDDSNDEIFASNGNPYCLPGDIAVCLLVSKTLNCTIEAMPLSICFKGSECSIIGFPSIDVENPISIFPYSGDDEQFAKERILNVFHRDKALIESKGKVLRNKNLLEITCSGINGMSGSPVVVQNSAVGIFVGGPPLPGQRELLKIATMIRRNKKKQEAWNLLLRGS